jgi:septal ring factor EnvC (AmiA/AmiB activator)
MSFMSEEPEGEEGAPEAPWPLAWAQYLWHYMRQEGTAFRRAPVAVLTTAVFLSYLWSLHDKNDYANQLTNAKSANESYQATIQALQSTKGQLQEELKGTSPELAAIQANRNAVRRQLQQYYVEAGEFLQKPMGTKEQIANDTNEINVGGIKYLIGQKIILA